MNEYGFIPLRFLVLLTVLQPENITCVFLISRWGYAAVGVYACERVCVCVSSGHALDCRWAPPSVMKRSVAGEDHMVRCRPLPPGQ